MHQRLSPALLGVVVLLVAAAFAPAPLPKPDRRNNPHAELLARLQGTWTLTAKQMMTPDGLLNTSTRQKVQIEKDRWQFVSAGKGGKGGKGGGPPKAKKASIGYRIDFEPGGLPRVFRLRRTVEGEPEYAYGLLGFEGPKLRVLYRMNYEDPDLERPPVPPSGFHTVPMGWYLLTLERE